MIEDVRRFLRRSNISSPTDYTRKLKVGDLCLRCRTSFSPSAPKKLQFKLKIEAYEVTAKIATNSFRVQALTGGRILVLPGDILIIAASLTKSELVVLVREMERIASRNAALSAPLADGWIGSRTIRRSSRLREQNERVDADCLRSDGQ